jgi:hypothetical protein
MSDLKERLQDNYRSDEFADTWRPEAEGEMLVGTFEKMAEGTTSYGTYPIAHIRDESGQLRAVWFFHAVLKDQWEQAEPEPGDQVGIIYKGQREGSDFRYHAYGVEVERQGGDATPTREPERPALRPDEGHDRRPTPSMDDPNAELPY